MPAQNALKTCRRVQNEKNNVDIINKCLNIRVSKLIKLQFKV